MMGGKIWVESGSDQGSAFHFTAQLRVAQANSIAIGAITPTLNLRGVRVLVVDDNRTNRRILEGMLKRWEMNVTSVEGGEEALAHLAAAKEAEEPYVLILADMHMPGMDGFELVERIRQRPELSTATIMMLTSAGHRGDAARCEELEVSAYLLKPIRQSELREAVARVLGAKEQRSEIPLVTRYSLQDVLDPSVSLRVLLAEDNLVNQRLGMRLLEKRGHSVVVAGNGRETLAAFESGGFDLILMDLQMPEMDGFEATTAIRERERESGNRVPIVALTAHAMKGEVRRPPGRMGRSTSQGLHGAPLSPARRRVQTRDGFHWRRRDRKIWVRAGIQRCRATTTGRVGARRRIRAGTEAKSDSGEVMLYFDRVTSAARRRR